MNKIVNLIKQDPVRLKALEYVYQLGLPQCYIAAGFVRNMVWDSLHNIPLSTPLNDIDVIYYEPNESNPKSYLAYEAQLKEQMPTLNWQVRNQATMHKRNGDLPYTSTLDAMRYWPEKETAIAIRQITADRYECIAAFGFESLFNGWVTHNPKRTQEIFESRVTAKNWLVQWPHLKISPY
jgi:hypothetical protein